MGLEELVIAASSYLDEAHRSSPCFRSCSLTVNSSPTITRLHRRVSDLVSAERGASRAWKVAMRQLGLSSLGQENIEGQNMHEKGQRARSNARSLTRIYTITHHTPSTALGLTYSYTQAFKQINTHTYIENDDTPCRLIQMEPACSFSSFLWLS